MNFLCEKMSSLTRTLQPATKDSDQLSLPKPSDSKPSVRTPSPSQKLFFKPGTEKNEDHDNEEGCTSKLCPGVQTPVVVRRNQLYLVCPRKVPSLHRISTYTSSLGQMEGTRQDSYRATFRTDATRDFRRRVVFKNGDFNLIYTERPIWDITRWLVDFFTTLVEMRWKWTLLIFTAAFMLSWLLFAVVWWLLFFVHGDLQPQNMPPLQDQNNFSPCVIQIYDFTSAFLFSIETQSTIGYGGRMITEECPEGIFLVCFQSIIGVIIEGYFGGIVVAKLTRPRKRAKTLMFSRFAIVSERDGKLCLMIRVGDLQLTHLTGASVRLHLVHNKKTKEGDVLNNYITDLEVSVDGCGPDLFFVWPQILCHAIDEDSPFYGMPPSELLQGDFELVVILDGSQQSTGQDVRAVTSYLPHEILWGFRFEETVVYDKESEGYEIDYSKFNVTVPVETPLCSGEDLEAFYELERKGEKPDRKKILRGSTEQLQQIEMAVKSSTSS